MSIIQPSVQGDCVMESSFVRPIDAGDTTSRRVVDGRALARDLSSVDVNA
jgi:hypothetical protein